MKRGLTLIEVLVSLTIASMSIAALAHSTWSILQARRASDLQQAATLLAERRLEELVAAGAGALSSSEASETVVDPAGEFTVRTRVEPGPNDSLWHLAVTASPSQGGSPVRLHTLLHRSWGSP
jgi:prepilin-type N-terminal cleavage/methylation domain-containing protein